MPDYADRKPTGFGGLSGGQEMELQQNGYADVNGVRYILDRSTGQVTQMPIPGRSPGLFHGGGTGGQTIPPTTLSEYYSWSPATGKIVPAWCYIALTFGPNGLAQTAHHRIHRPPTRNNAEHQAHDLRFAGRIVIPQLHRTVVCEGHEEPVDGRVPSKAVFNQNQLGYNQRMQQARQIRAGQHTKTRRGRRRA